MNIISYKEDTVHKYINIINYTNYLIDMITIYINLINSLLPLLIKFIFVISF